MRVFLALFFLLGSCSPIFAHEFWLEPEHFTIARDEPVKLTIRSGDNFTGELLKSQPVTHLTMLAGHDRRDLTSYLSRANESGVISVESAHIGTVVVALKTEARFIELAPEIYREYLEEDGLDAVRDWRAAHGAQGLPGRELYRHEAATLLLNGAPTIPSLGDTSFDLQIVPASNPQSSRIGDVLQTRILWRGAPLANVLVQRWTRTRAGVDIEKARSNAQGLVSFRLLPGDTMLSAIHIYENDDKRAADWYSVWGSLTFHVE